MSILLIYSIIISLLFIALSICFIYLLKRFVFWVTNIEYIVSTLNDYAQHLDAVQQMDTFSGEPIIENLFKNTKFVSQKVNDFIQIVDFFMEENEEQETHDDNNSEEEKEGE